MKLRGLAASEFCQVTVQLPRGAGQRPTLTLRPLPLGFSRRLQARGVVPPSPPLKVARDASGKPIRQADGLAAVVPDERDVTYREELELYHQRVAVLAVVEALRGDSNVEFATPAEAHPGDWRSYADGLYAEMEEAGWVAGDLVWLCQEICRLSNLIDDQLKQAGQHFFPLVGGAETS